MTAPRAVATDERTAPPSRLRLTLGGADLSAALRNAVTAVRLVQRACLPAQLIVALEGAGELLRELWGDVGISVSLEPLDSDRQGPLFSGEVTAVERRVGAERRVALELRAYDALHRVQERRQPQAFDGGDLAAIAAEILIPHGLEPLDWPTQAAPKRLICHGTDDLVALSRLSIGRGVYFAVEAGDVRAFTMDGLRVVDLGPEHGLFDLRIERNPRAAWAMRKMLYWDLLSLEVHDLEGRGAGGTARTSGAVLESFDDAAARQQAREAEDAQRAIRVSGTTEGDPRLRPGVRVRFRHPDLDETVETTLFEVVHRLDARMGYVTEFCNEPPRAAVDTGTELAFGVVAEVDDGRHGCARLSLPWLDDLETDWLPVVAAGAGDGKGCIMLPEKGDQVACLLYGANPARGMILGGLFGEGEVATKRGNGGRDRAFILRTSRGQRLRLDDSGGLAELRNRDGSVLELTPGRVRLHAGTDLDIEAPGRRIRIRAASIDFEEA